MCNGVMNSPWFHPNMLILVSTYLQGMALCESTVLLNPLEPGLGYSKQLPDLSKLVQLTALTLADNLLHEMPSSLSKLTNLKLLDLSCNDELKVSIFLINLVSCNGGQ